MDQGAEASDLFVVVAGEIRLESVFDIEDTISWPTSLTATHAEKIVQPCVTTIARRGAGSVFGLAALLKGAFSAARAYSLRAVAHTDGAKVLRLSDTIARFAVTGHARELALQHQTALEELKAAKVAEYRESAEFKVAERTKRRGRAATKTAYWNAIGPEYTSRRLDVDAAR